MSLKNATEIIKILQYQGFQAYIVGGAVRDILLDRLPKDFDIATNATPDIVKKLFPDSRDLGKTYGSVQVKYKDSILEVGTFRTDSNQNGRHANVTFINSIEKDLVRRDFTVNAMALDPVTGEIIDPLGGLKDLENQIVRSVGCPQDKMTQDYLRMLRALNCAVLLGFSLAPTLYRAIKQNSQSITKLSGERVSVELLKMLTAPPHAIKRGIRLLVDTNMLHHILPELHDLIDFSQYSRYHIKSVFEHSLDVMQYMAEQTPDPMLRLIALLHDVGKKRTRGISEKYGTYNFKGHDEVGAEMVRVIFRRLHMPAKERKLAKHVVAAHIKIKEIAAKGSDKTVAKFIREHYSYLEPSIMLVRADRELVDNEPLAARIETLKQNISIKAKSVVACVIDGFEIMDIIKDISGKQIGEIKKQVIELQIQGKIKTKEDGLQFVTTLSKGGQ